MPSRSRSWSGSPKRKRSRSAERKDKSSSDSENEDKKKKKKKHKKHSKKSKKHHHHHHDKEEEALKFLKAAAKHPVDNPISDEDYYRKATEFRVWLQRQGRYLEDFSAEKSRAKFAKFVTQWNAGVLTPDFYKGMDSTAVTEKLSTHKWKFKNVTKDEVAQRETTRDSVDTFTKAKGAEDLAQLGPIAARQLAKERQISVAGPPPPPSAAASNARKEHYQTEPAPAVGPSRPKLPAELKEEARMAAFKAQFAPYLNFEKK